MNINTSAGVWLVFLYTIVMTGADSVTKLLSTQMSAAQFYAFGAAGVALFCVLAAMRSQGGIGQLRTAYPQMMLLRSCITLVACLCFYQAFATLYFAEVFLFIAFIPVVAAIFAGVLLHEYIGPWHIGGLGLGILGACFLFAHNATGSSWGYACAAGATFFSALSLVLERWLILRERRLLSQLFYPYAFVALFMGVMLPSSWQAVDMITVLLTGVYAALVFAARSLSIMALRNMVAAAVTPMMNLQFIWMVVCGIVLFGEWPTLPVMLGAILVGLSGAMCVHGSHRKFADVVPQT